jgi:hypothetical protein
VEDDSELQRAMRANKSCAKVVLIDGDQRRELLVKKSRLAAAQMAKLSRKVPWQSAELLDDKGHLLDIVRNVGEAGELEDVGPGRREDAMERSVGLVMKIVDRCMNARSNETREAMNALVLSVRETTAACGALAAIHRQSIEAAVELAQLRPELPSGEAPAPPEQSVSAKALEAAMPFLVQRLLSSLQPAPPTPAPPTPKPENAAPGNG